MVQSFKMSRHLEYRERKHRIFIINYRLTLMPWSIACWSSILVSYGEVCTQRGVDWWQDKRIDYMLCLLGYHFVSDLTDIAWLSNWFLKRKRSDIHTGPRDMELDQLLKWVMYTGTKYWHSNFTQNTDPRI